ncbi:unnamed protein product, partial [Closterium sp. Naga37s-1]
QLGGNQLTGSIPASFSKLVNLQGLCVAPPPSAPPPSAPPPSAPPPSAPPLSALPLFSSPIFLCFLSLIPPFTPFFRNSLPLPTLPNLPLPTLPNLPLPTLPNLPLPILPNLPLPTLPNLPLPTLPNLPLPTLPNLPLPTLPNLPLPALPNLPLPTLTNLPLPTLPNLPLPTLPNLPLPHLSSSSPPSCPNVRSPDCRLTHSLAPPMQLHVEQSAEWNRFCLTPLVSPLRSVPPCSSPSAPPPPPPPPASLTLSSHFPFFAQTPPLTPHLSSLPNPPSPRQHHRPLDCIAAVVNSSPQPVRVGPGPLGSAKAAPGAVEGSTVCSASGSKGPSGPAQAAGPAVCRQYRLDVLAAATGMWAEANKIGSGGFGDVYRAEDPADPSTLWAVKRAKVLTNDFRREVNEMATKHHPNLVRLLGFCIDGDAASENIEQIGIYEFMINGDLSKRLNAGERRRTL